MIHEDSSRNGGVALDKREERDSSDARRVGKAGRTTVRGPQFEVSGTSNPELRVALFPPVLPVSLESGIGDCSRSVHEIMRVSPPLSHNRPSSDGKRAISSSVEQDLLLNVSAVSSSKSPCLLIS